MLREGGCREYQQRCGRKLVIDGVCSGHDGCPSTHLSCCQRRQKVEDASLEGFRRVTGDVRLKEQVVHFVSN